MKLLFLNTCYFLPGFLVYSGFSVVPELRATPVSYHSQDITLSKGQWDIFQVARRRTQPGDFLLQDIPRLPSPSQGVLGYGPSTALASTVVPKPRCTF